MEIEDIEMCRFEIYMMSDCNRHRTIAVSDNIDEILNIYYDLVIDPAYKNEILIVYDYEKNSYIRYYNPLEDC